MICHLVFVIIVKYLKLTGGDGIYDPAHDELYCEKKKIFIEPRPLEDRVKECDEFIK